MNAWQSGWARKLKAIDVIDVSVRISSSLRGRARPYQVPTEFVAKAVQEWITAVGAKNRLHHPGAAPWENGYVESFNARLRDELLDGEIFYTLREAQIVIERLAASTSTRSGPHASLGYKPPGPPRCFVPAFAAWPAALRQPASLAHASTEAGLELNITLGPPNGVSSVVLSGAADRPLHNRG